MSQSKPVLRYRVVKPLRSGFQAIEDAEVRAGIDAYAEVSVALVRNPGFTRGCRRLGTMRPSAWGSQ